MRKKDHQEICNAVGKISNYVRFVGIINKNGQLEASYRRLNLKPLLNEKDTMYQFSHIAIRTGLDAFFDKSLGKIQFVWEEREKAQIISFAIKKNRIWVSIDKKVVRSEILRIIDSCMPIVKHYS